MMYVAYWSSIHVRKKGIEYSRSSPEESPENSYIIYIRASRSVNSTTTTIIMAMRRIMRAVRVRFGLLSTVRHNKNRLYIPL